ncbi:MULTISPECIES: hypothetical protein [Butyricimonas]|uniref:hypothetical protein n=1 Tax=Butyricimonas TaxID=574697 RepID=UPI0007FB2EC7|nr:MULTISPECIES: hypothetical protein [Butyricimonas]
MEYTDEDIEFARQILTHREELEDALVEKWMEDEEHMRLLDELAADRKSRRMTLYWSVAISIILILVLYIGRGVEGWKNLKEEKSGVRDCLFDTVIPVMDDCYTAEPQRQVGN